MASRFSTGTNANPGSVPIHTADDAQGNAAVGHIQMLEVGGIATAISNTNPTPTSNVTIGTVDDAAFNGVGSASLVAALKGIFNRLNSTVTVVDTAAETAANSINSATGNPTDAAWNSGSGTVISLLKAVMAAMRGTLAVADTNIGNLADAAYSSGSGSVVSVLKGIFGAVSKNVSVSSNLLDRSNLVAVANTAQQILSSNPSRIGFSVQPSADAFISFTGTAVPFIGSGSFKIPAGAIYETPVNTRPTGAVSLLSATQGATFALLEW